jgi:hypothetical protein
MQTWLNSAAAALLVAGSMAAADAPAVPVQVRPGELTRGEVWIMNRASEPVPVAVRQLESETPLRVRVVPPSAWDYQTVVIRSGADAARALASAGASGWETTGLSWPAADGTIVLLKKPR